MLCLTEEDILKAVTPLEIINSIESALILYEKKECHMPDRMHVDYKGNTLLLMPCFIQKSFGTKLVTVFPENINKNLPAVKGVMVLNDGETGAPQALINGSALTALRTGAVGSISIKYLTPENTHSLGIVGAGIQGFHQALFASTVRKFSDIYVFDCNPEKIPPFIEKLSKIRPKIQVHQTQSAEDLLKRTQVVITSTTSVAPVLPDKKELLEAKHFVGIGSYKPDMREFPGALFRLLKRIFIDTEHAIKETGDIVFPLKKKWITIDRVYTLGKLITGYESWQEGKKETTLFKSVGMALFDIVVSKLIYDKAVQKGLGKEIKL